MTSGAPPKKVKRWKLPAEAPPAPDRKKALLQWVQSQSPAWVGCTPRQTEPIVAAVLLDVDDHGRVENVSINADGALGSAAIQCLRKEIASLRLPEDLRWGRERYMFGLRI